MTNLIKISAEGQKTLMVDADKVNSVALHTTGENDENAFILLTADKYDDRICIFLDKYDVDMDALVNQIRAAGNDLIEVKAVRGEDRESYTEFISPKAIVYTQAESNEYRYNETIIHVGLKGFEKKAYFGTENDTFNKILNAFMKEAGSNVCTVPMDQAILGKNEGTELFVDTRDILRLSVDNTEGRIEFVNAPTQSFDTAVSNRAWKFESAVKNYLYGNGNTTEEFNKQALNDEMHNASFTAAASLVAVTRALAEKVDGMVEVPPYDVDKHDFKYPFHLPCSLFVRPKDITAVKTFERVNDPHSFYAIEFETTEDMRALNRITMKYPTEYERDQALGLYLQRCEDLKKKPQNTPAPKTRQTGKYKF